MDELTPPPNTHAERFSAYVVHMWRSNKHKTIKIGGPHFLVHLFFSSPPWLDPSKQQQQGVLSRCHPSSPGLPGNMGFGDVDVSHH